MSSGFSTLLQHVGDFFRKLFTGATQAAIAAEPIVDLAFPSVASLYNFTAQQVSLAEAAANGASGTGAQKLAAVVAAVTPYATSVLKADGVATPTSTQIEAYVNAVVASINALPAPVAAAPAQNSQAVAA